MNVKSIKTKLIIALGAALIAALVAGFCLMKSGAAFADVADYSESYRNRLAYSAKRGWNNDPNGLLYVNGTYHMYYQYTWDQRETDPADQTKPWWDDMSWGHATSTDLVHWEEKAVAIPAYQTVGDKYYGMMFSGSAVYDVNNTSGLFDVDGSGKVTDGQGIVAILTQPDDNAGGQRQILAYSKDGGTSFTIYGEILGANAEGSLGDGEFRDPKVFWDGTLNKWLMAVGGGSVRMYSSDNLKEWSYLGETGYWGECPDISRFEVDGENKYVLIISPEDKNKSHEYNGTNRVDTYYPAEYYVVGELDEGGLFRGTQPVKRLSEGIDCYAFQSFNNVPDGKVYGISWSASWLTVGAYEGYRQTHNGGMTVACELALEKDGSGYTLLRKPADNLTTLRSGEIKSVSGKVSSGINPLADVKASEADIELELDFTDTSATYAELWLRVSAEEKTVIKYDKASQTLSLDRSESSLIAKNTNFFKDVSNKQVPLKDGKLNLRILLDRAFVSVFANGGYASYFSAVFPSAISNGMNLVSDGEIGVNARIYAVQSIFGGAETRDELLLTATKFDTVVGKTEKVIASSYANSFNAADEQYEVTDGQENISLKSENGTAYITAKQSGYSKVKVTYRGQEKFIDVFIYNDGFESDVNFTDSYRAFSYVRKDGLYLSGDGDAFLFGEESGTDFTYSANFTPQLNAQAGGLAFGYIGNASGYWFVTADVKENKVKLVEFCGEKTAAETLQTADCSFAGGTYKLTVTVKDGTVKAYCQGAKLVEYKLENYKGGRVGLNVYNSDMVVNGIYFKTEASDDDITVGSDKIVKIVNVTDGSTRLSADDYEVKDGKLVIKESYLKTLETAAEYTLRVITEKTEYDLVIKTDFTAAELTATQEKYPKSEELSFALSSGAVADKVEIDGLEYEFTVKEGNLITISAEAVKNLTSGEHVVKVYTKADGRVSAKFSLTGLLDYSEEETETVSHVFFWVDIAVFASLIVGYIAFTIVKKCKRGRGVKHEK